MTIIVKARRVVVDEQLNFFLFYAAVVVNCRSVKIALRWKGRKEKGGKI